VPTSAPLPAYLQSSVGVDTPAEKWFEVQLKYSGNLTAKDKEGGDERGFTLQTYTHATRQAQDTAAITMGEVMKQVVCPTKPKIAFKKRKITGQEMK